jgi:beta-glucosidase
LVTLEEVPEMVSKMTLEEKAKIVVGVGLPGMFGNPLLRVPGAAGETHPVERLGISSAVLAYGLAGL